MTAHSLSLYPPLAPETDFVVTPEETGDVAAREALLDAAMGPRRKRKSSEALRRGRMPAEGLAFSARTPAGRLTGTVRLWNVSAGERGGRPVPALLLGPLAVDPALKNAGLGTLLMRHALAEAARLGHAAVLLVGDPGYYERFGFRASAAAGLAMPGPFERHRLLGLELQAGALEGAAGLIRPTGRKATRAGTWSSLPGAGSARLLESTPSCLDA